MSCASRQGILQGKHFHPSLIYKRTSEKRTTMFYRVFFPVPLLFVPAVTAAVGPPTQTALCPRRGEGSRSFCMELLAWPGIRDFHLRTCALWFHTDPVQVICVFAYVFHGVLGALGAGLTPVTQSRGSSGPESTRTLRTGLFLLTKKTIKAVCLKLWLMDCMDYLFIFK